MKLIVCSFLVIIACAYGVKSLNILGVFPYQGKSHFFVFQPYLEELARRGHNLTVISHFPLKTPVKNYHDIALVETAVEGVIPIHRSYFTIVTIIMFLIKIGTENCKLMLSNENVQKLWENNEKFDLIIVEQFNSDCGLGLAWKLGAPVLGITSSSIMTWHYNRFGIPQNPAFVSPQLLGGGVHPTLYERVERVILDTLFTTFFRYYGQATDQNTLAEYIDRVPPLEELGRDIKFLLLYQNFVLTGSILFPPNVIEVGGYHVAKPKPLRDELQKYIDEAEHGVVYVSFGSMLKASSAPKDKIEIIISALSQLPQRVIWKWEEPNLPGNPKNIYVSNWLPQNDILAHPKVLAFYSHAGLLGTTEAIYNGVPMIAMPVFGDQPFNAAAIEQSGLGVQIQIKELSTELLLEKLKTVLDPKFRQNVKLVSKAWHDRPVSAMDSAIYWTEFTARYSNFTFRTPAADVPIYQLWNLDVIAVLTAISVIAVFIVRSVIRVLFFSKNIDKKKSKKE